MLRLPGHTLAPQSSATSPRGVPQVCALLCVQSPVAEALWALPRRDPSPPGLGVVSHMWPARQETPGKLLPCPVPSTLVMIPMTDWSELWKEQSEDLLLQMNHLNLLQELKTLLRQSSKKLSLFLQNLPIFSPTRFATKSHNKTNLQKPPSKLNS